MEVKGYEAYDSRLAIESLSGQGFWIDDMYVKCRTGESLGLSAVGTTANRLEGSAFYWYDTGQSHIITNSVFENCGFRDDSHTHYGTSPTRGCKNDNANTGCSSSSTTFGFLTHSDRFNPEVMQGTNALTFVECGRRFRFTQGTKDTVSGRLQNWLDADGTASGLLEPTLIASGLESVETWWGVDDDGTFDTIRCLL